MTLRRFLSGSVCAGLMVGLPALPAADPVSTPTAPAADASPAITVDHSRSADRSFRVRLSEDGTLTGTVRVADAAGAVRPAKALTLVFLADSQVPAAFDGGQIAAKVAAKATPKADGRYVVSGLTPGLYSVVGRGEEGFMTFGLHVLPAGEGSGEFDVMAAPPKDVAIIAALAGRFVTAPAAAELSAAAARTAPAVDKTFEESEALAGSAAPIKRSVVRVAADGTLSGQLVTLYDGTGAARPFSDSEVFLLRDGQVVQKATPDAAGSYELTDLTDGVYTLASLGRTGVSAVAIEVAVADAVVENAVDSPFRRVALRKVVRRQAGGFPVAVVPPFASDDRDPIGAVFGTGGGAAGGGGGGGLLGIGLVAGGITALVLALADDDDDEADVRGGTPSRPNTGGTVTPPAAGQPEPADHPGPADAAGPPDPAGSPDPADPADAPDPAGGSVTAAPASFPEAPVTVRDVELI